MSDYVTLLGAEQVQRAASEMTRAAEAIRQHVSYLDDVLERHMRLADALVSRLEALKERADE